MKAPLALFLIAACGSSGGGTTTDAPKSVDAKTFMDAPPVVPATITVSGTASADTNTGSAPLANVVVGFYKASDETTPLASSTTAADGKYSFTITTNGLVVDGFLKATISGYTDNYTYPGAPLQADAPMLDSSMITTTNFALLGGLAGQQSGDGLIVAEVLDANKTAVAGAAISSTPASGGYLYGGSSGAPMTGTATGATGVGFFISVPAGPVTIGATKAGATFKSHSLNAHANAFTSTIITE